MKRWLVVVSFIFCVGSGGAARGDVENCIFHFRLLAPVNIAAEFSPRDTRLIRGAIGRMQTYAGSLSLPSVEVVQQNKPSYNTLAKSLGIKLASGIAERRNDVVILAHEYGHAVFSENLKIMHGGRLQLATEVLKSLLQEKATVFTNPNYLRELNLLRQQQKALPAGRSNDGSKSRKLFLLERAIAKLPEKHLPEGLAEKIREVQNRLDWALPNDELFADILAVMLARDGAAMENALQPIDSLTAASRNFTNPSAADPAHLDLPSNFIYAALNLTRTHLWTHHLADARVEDYPKILRAFMAATNDQMRMQNGRRVNSYDIDIDARNAEFIALFEQHMK